MLKMALTSCPSTDCKTNILLTSAHNDADNTDATDDADVYSRVIAIALLKAFSCAKKRLQGVYSLVATDMYATTDLLRKQCTDE